jgi:tRNA(fMet)-specific endonuclease VapC
MTKLALDTNAYSALNAGDLVLARLVKTASTIGLPLSVLGEIYFGIFNSTRQSENLADLQDFTVNPRVILLAIDETTCRIYGEIATTLRQTGHPIQQNDMWIAALCKQYGYVLATRDTDFQAIIGLETVCF